MPKKKLLSDYVIEDIKAMLLDGRLKEGDKLPNQNDFSKELGVSRVSLREALKALEMMGVLRQRPKTGTVILNGNPETWTRAGKLVAPKDEKDMRQMLIARKCLEPAIAEEAVKNITPEQLKELTRVYYELRDAYSKRDVDEYAAKDNEFHLLIAKACRNRYLQGVYEIAMHQIDIFMREVLRARPEAFDKTLRLHCAIYEAVNERDAQRARKTASNHAIYIENLLMQFFRGEAFGNGSS